MKKIILYLIVSLLITQVNAIQITEIMYNPQGNDNNKEFIEIEGTNNLSVYTIGDLEQNDTLNLLYYNENSNYSLIVEEGFNYTGINASIYSAGATIGNNLDNTQDTLFLFKENQTIVEVNYTNEFANDNGYSLEFWNNEWVESNNKGGSPGEKNLPHTEYCNIELNLNTDKEIYLENETVKFQNLLSDEIHQYIISYYITDLFNNLIKEPKNTSNNNEKSFTPYIFETEQVFMIHNELIFIDCNNTNNNTKTNKTIIIKGNKIKESKIGISKIDKTLEFGDTLWANLEIYKGNSSNGRLDIYLQRGEDRITKKSKLDLKTNYQEYKLSIPINIPFDCQNKFENGTYRLIIEGFDLIEETEVNIAGRKEICFNIMKEKDNNTIRNKIKESQEEIKEGSIKLELINYPKEIEIDQEFQVELRIDNQKFTKQKISIYSYVYSGPISISGEREENKQEFEIDTNSQKEIKLKNKVFKFKNNTKLKIKYTIDGKDNEITESINVLLKEEEAAEQYTETEKYQPSALNSITTNAIYESSGEVSKKYGLYILIGTLILIITLFGIKNEFYNKNNNRNSGFPKRTREFDSSKSSRKNQNY